MRLHAKGHMQQGEHMLVVPSGCLMSGMMLHGGLLCFPTDVKYKLRLGISLKMKETTDFVYLAAHKEFKGYKEYNGYNPHKEDCSPKVTNYHIKLFQEIKQEIVSKNSSQNGMHRVSGKRKGVT